MTFHCWVFRSNMDVIPTTYYVLAGHEVKHPNKKGLKSSFIYIARACNEKHDTSVNYA